MSDSKEERVQLSEEDAIAMLPNKKTLHTFRTPSAGILIGADWSRVEVVKAIRKYGAELSGPAAASMHHAICINDGRWVFVETRK